MGLSTTALIPRRAFLALGLTAASACLTACSGKGSYDDGYAAGHAAAQADAAGKEKDGSGGDGDIPVSGIEYTITGAQRGVESYSDGKPLLILNVTAKNVSDDLQAVIFSGNEILAHEKKNSGSQSKGSNEKSDCNCISGIFSDRNKACDQHKCSAHKQKNTENYGRKLPFFINPAILLRGSLCK